MSGLWKSYLSPIYWILRLLGKDLKEADRDDIDEDLFRLCLKPKTGVEAKKVHKAVRHIYGKILGVDDKTVGDSLSVYYELRDQLHAARDNNSGFGEEISAIHALDDFVAATFTAEVTEEEREEVLKYLKGNSYMRVVKDEYLELKHEAAWEVRTRKRERFEQEVLENLRLERDDDFGEDAA